ncbi:anthranilate synthase component I family protein [Persephonella sp.]
MEIKLFSSRKGWFEKEGLFVFNRPVFSAVFDRGVLTLGTQKIKTKNPFPFIEKAVRSKKLYAVGFISYDFKRYIWKETVRKKRDMGLPLVFFAFFKTFSPKKIPESVKNETSVKGFYLPVSKESYIKKVLTAKKYIEDGDIYQINLSHRIELEGFFDVDGVFYTLIQTQPTPYMMSIKTSQFSLVSGSMELFLEKAGKDIKTVPIKGTRRAGNTGDETRLLKEELFHSEKERAENLMITDLMRNDIGKIAEKGTVKVEKLFDVQVYSTVLQMGSTVKGKLKTDVSLADIVNATFPPGSVTGAPKKRAVEIIDLLENFRREVYCGANVLIKPSGDFVMSVAIRQIIFRKNKAYIYVGSGIVADSDPEKEYEETLIKAKAGIKAVGLNTDIF